jgi:hypothetical protein
LHNYLLQKNAFKYKIAKNKTMNILLILLQKISGIQYL